MELLRKITIKSCGGFTMARVREVLAKGGKDGAAVAEGESMPILRITGMVSNARTGQTEKGTFTRLMGQFVGTDMTTGALYQSGQCILPEFVGSQLGAALLGSGNDGKSAVEFAVEIGAKSVESSLAGYEYTVRPLIETAPSDRMAALMKAAGIALPAAAPAPALAAPPAAGTPAPTAPPAAGTPVSPGAATQVGKARGK